MLPKLPGSEFLLSKIDQMAHLVLANPNITVGTCRKTGYAEPKSIYYWLDKAGFRGMKDFRRAVLSRSFPIPTEPSPEVKDSHRLPPIPLYTANDSLERLDVDQYLKSRLGARAFAVLISKNEFGGMATPGDLLVIDPDGSFSQGDLALANLDGKPCIVRVYYLPNKSPIYVDISDIHRVLLPDFINGKVAFVVRHSI